MTGETRIALLLGMIFIFAFGLVLGEIAGPETIEPGPAITLRDVDYLARPSQGQQVRRQLQPAAEGVPGIVRRRPADNARLAGRPSRPTAEQAAPRPRGPVAVVNRTSTNHQRQGAGGTMMYRVRPDDTLIGIARKAYGPENGHLWVRIRDANRDRITDPSAIPVGATLRIPTLSTDVAQRSPDAATGAAVPPARSRRPAGGQTASVGIEGLREWLGVGSRGTSPSADRGQGQPSRRRSRVYVTRRGDNLTTIAREQMGDDSAEAIDRLFKANRNRLNSPHIVPVGVRLRIPS